MGTLVVLDWLWPSNESAVLADRGVEGEWRPG